MPNAKTLKGNVEGSSIAGKEREAQQPKVVQAPLFTLTGRGELSQPTADIPALSAQSSLDVARWWFKRDLEQQKRPINTIDSYMYDLALFQQSLGNKTLEHIGKAYLVTFLCQAKDRKSVLKRQIYICV